MMAMPAGSAESSKRPLIRDLNAHLICVLCGGYFVDAVTIVECLHSFCRSCIVRHLETSKFCPICEVQVHKGKPLSCIRRDQTLQSLVYKVVPDLYSKEQKNRNQFYKNERVPEEENADASYFFSAEDSISLSLEYFYSGTADDKRKKNKTRKEKSVHRRYLQCPAAVKINHLKKFVRMKHGLDHKHIIDIIYCNECQPDDLTLMDLAYIFQWDRYSPMRFSYRILQPPVCIISPSNNTASEDVTARQGETEHMLNAKDLETSNSNSREQNLEIKSSVQTEDHDKAPVIPENQIDIDIDESKEKRHFIFDTVNNEIDNKDSINLPENIGNESDIHSVRCNLGKEILNEMKNIYSQNKVKGADLKASIENTSIEDEGNENERNGDQTIVHVPVEQLVDSTESGIVDLKNEGNLLTYTAVDSCQNNNSQPYHENVKGNSFDLNNQEIYNDMGNVNVEQSCDTSEADEDEFALYISSNDQDGETAEESIFPTVSSNTLTKSLRTHGDENHTQKENLQENEANYQEEIGVSKIKVKHKENRRKSKHKSKHHHQKYDEPGTKKRKIVRAEIISSPMILPNPEDVMKLKVKLSPVTNPVITNISSSNSIPNQNKHHHHHHSKHHYSKHNKQQNVESNLFIGNSNGETSVSAKERLLQMRTMKHKNNINMNKVPESVTVTYEGNMDNNKKTTLVIPSSSITMSKVTPSEKRKLDLQKSQNVDCKRPSLEIMLVSTPTTITSQSSNAFNNKAIMKNSTSSLVKHAVVSYPKDSNNSASSQSDVQVTVNTNMTKCTRPLPGSIPLMSIKRHLMQTSTIKAPSGLTITPKITLATNKISLGTNDSINNREMEIENSSQDCNGSEDISMKRDDVGALDLSGKSSRYRPCDGDSSSPILEICSPISSSSSSPGKMSNSSNSHHAVQNNALRNPSAIHQQNVINNNSSSRSVSPGSSSSSFPNNSGDNSPDAKNLPCTGNHFITDTSSISNTTISNLQTLSDTAVHIQNLMVSQNKCKNALLAGALSKQRLLAANIQVSQQQKSAATYTGNSNISTLQCITYPLLQKSMLGSTNASSQYTIPVSRGLTNNQMCIQSGTFNGSSALQLKIPVPPSTLSKALTSGSGNNSSAGESKTNPCNSVTIPRLHEILQNSTLDSRARNALYSLQGRNNNISNKPGPNQGVRHIPNPSALLFRQNRFRKEQQSQQNSNVQSTNTAGVSNSNNIATTSKESFIQKNNLSDSLKNNVTDATAVIHSSASCIRKMESMTRNIETVAASLTVKVTEKTDS